MNLTFALTLATHLGLAGVASDAALDPHPPVAKQDARTLAQDGSGGGGQASGSQAGSSKKKKVIRLDALTVEGRIQKPQAFYILQRSNLNFEELNRTESFIPKVEKSVDGTPF